MTLRKFLVAITVAVLVLLCAVVWLFPPNDDFSTDNPHWNGTSSLHSIIPVTPLQSLSKLPISPKGSTLILIPCLPFDSVELVQLNSFVTSGGTVVLADDYGNGNQVLQYLGLTARFSGDMLLDAFSNYKSQAFPRISHLVTSSITNDVKSLVFDHGTYLTHVGTADALALSSSYSYADSNGNGKLDAGEPVGPFPVVTQYALSGGKIILISDPSILINSMETIGDNHIFIQNIGMITASQLLIDQSHLPKSDLANGKSVLAAIRNSLITPVGTVLSVMVVAAVALMPIWHKKEETEESL